MATDRYASQQAVFVIPDTGSSCTSPLRVAHHTPDHGETSTEAAMGMRVCAEPDCPKLIPRGKQSRCPAHAREQDEARGTRQQRGYDTAHDQLRRDWQRRMNQGEHVTCWRCDNDIDPEHWHLGHDDDDRSVYRGPECVPCNTATAGRH